MSEATQDTKEYFDAIFKDSKSFSSSAHGRQVGLLIGHTMREALVDYIVHLASKTKENSKYDTYSYRFGIVAGYLEAIGLHESILEKHHLEKLKTQ